MHLDNIKAGSLRAEDLSFFVALKKPVAVN